MKKVLYAIKTTKKYEKRINAILNTWLEGIDDYIFYSDHEDLEKNIILSSNDSSYLSGTLSKTLWFFNNLKDIFVTDDKNILDEYKWIFFVDDDTFVNVKNLEKLLVDLNDSFVYGHLFTREKNSDNPIWNKYKNILKESDCYHSGGAGYLISTKILKSMSSFDDIGIIFDDATIGINLIRNDINLIHNEKFNPENPDFFDKDDIDIVNQITYHHIDPVRMFKLNKILRDE